MGYCFKLLAYDYSGNWIDIFEYAGSFGIGTMEGFLNNLRELCNEIQYPLPPDVLFFSFEYEYDFVVCSEILECLEALKKAIKAKKVSWRDEDRQEKLEDFIKLFSKAIAQKGYVEQTFSE